MSRFVFPSVINPNQRFAIYGSYSDNPGYNWRNSCTLGENLARFDTLGDGDVQHTPESSVANTFENAEDFVMSSLAVLDSMPGGDSHDADPTFDRFHRMIVPYSMPTESLLKFIGSLKYDSSKYVYVNFSDMKKSTADAKQHDKRWTKLESCYDGSIAAFRRGIYDAGLNGGNCIAAVLRDLDIFKFLDKGPWQLSNNLSSETRTVFSGIDQSRLERFICTVQSLREYCEARAGMYRTLSSLTHRGKRFVEKLNTVEA